MYTIKLLSNKEFDRLPYKGAHQALGLADPKTNSAFVRFTAYPELNRYLVNHEFEHLIEETPTDEIDGVRYFAFASILPALWGGLKAAGSFLGTKALPAIGGALKSGGGYLSSLFGGGAASRPVTGIRKGFTSAAGLGQGFLPGTSPFQTVSSPQDRGGGALSGLFSGLLKNKTALGSGLLGLGLLKPFPKAPQLPQSVEDLRAQIQGGGGPLGQQARGVLQQQLGRQFEPLTQPEIDVALRQYRLTREQQKKTQITDQYKFLRPSADMLSDSSFARDVRAFDEQTAQGEADILASATRGAREAFDVNQRLAIQQAGRFTDSEIDQLATVAQLDLNKLVSDYGMDIAQAQQFKETFSNLGSQILMSGLGVQSPFSMFGI